MAVDEAQQKDADSMIILEDAFERFQESGLRLPPVPRELISDLDEFSDWYWGTDELNLFDAQGFVEEANTSDGDPNVAFGHTGHGVNSWWLCYRLRLGSIGVFVRMAYGGAYGDNEAAAERFNSVSEMLESIIPAADAARAAGRFQLGHRIVVVLDDTGENFWQVAGQDEEPHRTNDPISDAMAFLSQPLLHDNQQP